MDIRSQDPNYQTTQQQQNISNVAIYNLIKRKSIYKELVTEYSTRTKIRLGSTSSYIPLYSGKPVAYLICAGLYHMKIKRLGAAWFFIHAGGIMIINQYDTNVGAKNTNPEKWDEYQEATKNYQTALSMVDASPWEFLKDLVSQKFTARDYLNVLQLRPH